MFGLKVLCLTILATWGQAAIVTDRESLANELDEPQSLKSVILDVKERLDKWDAFFMGRLEPRMLGAATSLANLDTNIRNLQERAHIWDTFQLHVSAWNDQIQALDDKVNYLNEHLLTQENTALNTNGSLQQIVSKLTALESKMGNGVHHGVAPLFGDFAARGLLHTVRQLEHKLDKMQLSLDRIKFSQNKGKIEISEGEDMISAKETHEDFEEIFGHPTEVRHSGNPCRRLIGPAKKLFEGVEIIKRVLLDLVEETAEGDKSELRQRRRLPELGAIRNSLEDIEESITRLGRQQDRNVNENERILRRIDKKLDQLDREEDDNEREVLKRLKSIDRQLGGIKKEMDEDDNDSDDNDGRRRKNKNDTDEDDDDDSDDDDDDDSDNRPRKKGKKNDDTDEDDDSDDDDRRKNKRKNNNDTDEDDDDSDDDDRHKNKRKNKNDTDEDDDDSDDDDRHKNKRKNKNDTDEDDDDSDDDDRRKNKRKNKNDTDEDDDSDENGRKKNKSNDDTDEDDDDEDKRGKNKDTDEDDDTREKNDTDDDDSDDEDEGGNGRNHRKSRETPLIVENGTTPLSRLLTNTGK